ncbi:hypothetical protein P3X46_018986 [Hevea brasiliensis]|uniref:Bifunctional inhibitor/plant lipid transfer protein/seed storage helical domain-containing protein n=1 Tax=Hevea brasiliensis TaxID=3981 RepID=A0ABQ9LSD7_HEVBR|nr:hypothetical protein P3X46_018986 [Hevea brasiliensis]
MHKVLLLIVLSLVLKSITAQSWTDLNCADVVWDILPCMSFLQGIEPTHLWGFCIQLKDLNKIADPKKGKRTICQCIEEMVYDEGQPISSRITSLSSYCGVIPSFPISNDMDCDS